MLCIFRYNAGTICNEVCNDGNFCKDHKLTYQARVEKKLVPINTFDVIFKKGEAISILRGNKLLPLGKEEINLIENRNLKVNQLVKDVVLKEEDPPVDLRDTCLDL